MLHSPLSPCASRRKKTAAEFISFGCVHIKIQVPWETGNQRAHYLQQISYTECLLELLRFTFTYSLSLELLCSSHREVIELRSRLQSSQPPLQRAAAFVQGVFVLLGGCVCTEDKQMLLPGRGTERLSCVGQILWDSGPLMPRLPLRVSGPLRTVSALWWKWIAQQVQEFAKQNKHRSAPTVSDHEQIVHWLFQVHLSAYWKSFLDSWFACITYLDLTGCCVCLCWILNLNKPQTCFVSCSHKHFAVVESILVYWRLASTELLEYFKNQYKVQNDTYSTYVRRLRPLVCFILHNFLYSCFTA